MTIIEAINNVDNLKQNTYSQEDKIAWLSRVDSMVKTQIIDTHEGAADVSFSGYHAGTDLQTVLLVPAPFDELYLRWLEAQIDYVSGEITRYNNSIDMFNTVWTAFQNHYNRTHRPKGVKMKFF